MTPQERQMIDDLFDRLSRLEGAPRDADANAAIADGLRRAPNAIYALTQTVLVQDEALKRANARIEELEDGGRNARPSGGFLDSMRGAIMGQGSSRGSVPSVRPSQPETRSPWSAAQAAPLPRGGYAPQTGGGSSFLGTAAAAATGVIGGSLLMNGIRGLMGGGPQQSFGGDLSDNGHSPWSSAPSNDALSRDAGINDIGKNDNTNDGSRFARSDRDWDNETVQNPDYGQDDGGFDGGGFDGGGSDYA